MNYPSGQWSLEAGYDYGQTFTGRLTADMLTSFGGGIWAALESAPARATGLPGAVDDIAGVRARLDWTRISPRTCGDATEHVALNHGRLSLTKPNQGVFYGDPVATIEDAWRIANANSLKPTTVGNRDFYIVPRQSSGLS